MAAILLLLLLSTFFSVSVQQGSINISLGSSLSPGTDSSWFSHSGRFALGFYEQGDVFSVGIWFNEIPGRKVVWTANRDEPPVSKNATLLLTTYGWLILQNAQDEEKVIANTSQPTSYASMLDSGNFVLYNSDSEIIWQSFDFPTDTLLQGQRLQPGKILFSSVSEADQSMGRFMLAMQQDGHLVQYPTVSPGTAEYAYWASGTSGKGVTLNLDDDGHLYLFDNISSRIIMNLANGGFSTNRTIFYRMTIDVDGIFRVYSKNLIQNSVWEIEWSSSINNCSVLGICGPNGYCAQSSSCKCLPGFDFIDQNQQTLGCKKNFSEEDCTNKNDHTRYTMYELNMTWEDAPYSILHKTTKQGCEENCLGDCICEAVLFNNGQCRKQKLPLKFGRKMPRDSTITSIKVGIGRPVSTKDTQVTKEINKVLRKDVLIICVSSIACVVIILAFISVIIYRHRVWAYKKMSEQGNVGLTQEIVLQSFTYGELEKVTQGFKEELGRGSFGTVFKGILSNSQKVVAVKRLENMVKEGENEFQNEMTTIGRTHHRNLVRLLGYCHEGTNRLLVYEYMSNGSLADFLFKYERHPNWDERVGIALHIARGILYLHEECETQIIHCDIKPQNILIDEYRCAKIADFGLAKLLKPNQSTTSTGIRGTRGYVAPEWHQNMPITVKADVYSFGVVLLEIICCRKGVDINAPKDEIVLSNWVCDCFETGQLGKLVTNEDVDKGRLESMVRVGLWCIQDEPSFRPSIKKVVLMLEGTVDIPVPPNPTFLIPFNIILVG